MYGFEPLGGILWIIFLVIIVGVIIRLIRGSGYHGMYHRGWREEKDEAVDILKERYAKGEINKEEFEQKKSDLMK